MRRATVACAVLIALAFLTGCSSFSGPSIPDSFDERQSEEELAKYAEARDGCALSGVWHFDERAYGTAFGYIATEVIEDNVRAVFAYSGTRLSSNLRTCAFFGWCCGTWLFEGTIGDDGRSAWVVGRTRRPHARLHCPAERVKLWAEKDGNALFLRSSIKTIRAEKVRTNECGIPEPYVDSVEEYVVGRKKLEQLGQMKLAAEREKQEQEQLALSGDPEAQYQLGSRLASDNAERRKWLRLAAEQGHVEAMYALATISDAGGKEQMQWYCQAAIWGNAEAQFLIGQAFADESSEAQRDLIKASLWIKAARANGYVEKQYAFQKYKRPDGTWACCIVRPSKDLLEEMTPAQIAEAERLATDWVPNAKDCYDPGKAQATN